MATRDKPLRLVVLAQEAQAPTSLLVSGIERGNPRDSVTGSQPEELLQVGELAKATGKTVRAIHLYEELGLVRAHERSKGRYRLFSEEALVRVRWITKLQSLGLSLSEIQELVREQEASGTAQFAASRLRHVYNSKLEETRTKLAELRALEAELQDSLAYLDACNTACASELPVHSCPAVSDTPSSPRLPNWLPACTSPERFHGPLISHLHGQSRNDAR